MNPPAHQPQPIIDDAGFAELNKAIVESATQSQNVKKKNLLSQARFTNNIRKKVRFPIKATPQQTLSLHAELWKKCTFNLTNLSQLVEDVNSNERFNQYRGTIGVRKLLSIDGPPIQPIIDANLVPRMIEFVKREDEPQLQVEAAWVLTNVASGTTTQTQTVMDKGAITWFSKILRSNNKDLREQAIWALGNISGDSAINRNIALKHGVLQPLLKIVDEPDANLNIIKQGTWAISNLCRGRPIPKADYVKAAIPTLFNVLSSQSDSETLTDAAWALSYLSGYEHTLDIVMSCSSAVPTLVSLLSHSFLSIVIPCLRTLGNICAGDEAQTDVVLNCPDFLGKIYELLLHTKKSVRRESIWIISNITAGSSNQISRLFQSYPFVEKLISYIQNDSDEIKKESLWVFSNALKHGSVDQSADLCNVGVLNCFIFMLQTSNNASTLKVTLDGLYQMLNLGKVMASGKGSEKNEVLYELGKAGALDKYDTLQDFDDEYVYNVVVKTAKEFMPFIEIRPRPTEEEDFDLEDDYNDDDDDEEN